MEIKKKTSPSLCNPSPQISMSAPFPTSVSLGHATISRASFVVSARLAMNWTEAVGTAQVSNHSHSRWGPRYPRGCWGAVAGGITRTTDASEENKGRVRSGTDEVWGHKGKSRVHGPGLELGVPEGCFWGAVWHPAIFFPPWPSSKLQGPYPGISGLSLVLFQCNAHTFPPLLWVLTSRGPDKCGLPMHFLCVWLWLGVRGGGEESEHMYLEATVTIRCLPPFHSVRHALSLNLD